MKITPIHIVLKNGKAIELREATVADAQSFIDTAKVYCEESEFIPYVEGEFKVTLQEQEEYITTINETKNSILIVAIHEGKVIGNIDITGEQRQMMKHTGVVGMGMLKEWRSLGVGTALFEAAINWAKNKSILEIICLYVVAHNNAGIALYKKMGFEDCGRMSGFMKYPDGSYADDITMILKIK